MGKIYQNDVGVEIRVATTVDFNTASVKQIKVRKPRSRRGYVDGDAV
jgi:hypothetical protein